MSKSSIHYDMESQRGIKIKLLCNKRSRGAVKWVEYQLGNTELDSKKSENNWELGKFLCVTVLCDESNSLLATWYFIWEMIQQNQAERSNCM